jgi:hypothetical protein
VEPNGEKSYSWRTTSFESKKGATVIGRHAGSDEGVVIQVGHQAAFASGAPEVFMVEDAEINQVSGQTIENKGAYSIKEAVVVDGVVVELQSLQLWERLGEVPPGTVAQATKAK